MLVIGKEGVLILKKVRFLVLSFVCLCLFLFIDEGKTSAYSPVQGIPQSIKDNWNKTTGGKQFKMDSGRTLVYDIYFNKYEATKGGYRIVEKDFGQGPQFYLNFRGWAINFGRQHHKKDDKGVYNHNTYIVASSGNTHKFYSTDRINLSATEELEFGNKGAGLTEPCKDSDRNKYNDWQNQKGCNMYYEGVGFDAYIPLNDLFPDETVSKEWRLFIVKEVDGYIVYAPLILPFEFEDKKFNTGTIRLSSGQNASQLRMVGTYVMRRDEPRKVMNIYDYFTTNQVYTRRTQDENGTVIWFGVISPHDDNKTRWASSAYWDFQGDQAVLSFIPEKEPPVHQSQNMTYTYRNGNDYWVKPNTNVTITLRQYDAGVGNKNQYIRLLGSGEFRARHDFLGSETNLNSVGSFPTSNESLSFLSAKRTELDKDFHYGTVQWTVLPKKHGQRYEILWHYVDRAENHRGYDTGEGKTNMILRVDGQAPTQNSSSITGARYVSGNNYWVKPNDTISVSYRQHDGDSGNKFQYLRILEGNEIVAKSRHGFFQISSHKEDIDTNSQVIITSANRTENTTYGTVQWHIQAKTHGNYVIERYLEDNVGNNTGYEFSYNLRVDGVAPTVQFRNNDDTANFHNREWDDTIISVRLKFSDEGSGYNRSRYAWTNSTNTPSQWSSWSTSSNYVVTKDSFGEWYLHVQVEDRVGNVVTTYKGPYKFNHAPVANFDISPSKIYNDTKVTFTNRSTDADGNALTYKWEQQAPNSSTWTQFSTEEHPSKVFNIKGKWNIRLTVSDGVATDTIIKSFVVENRNPTVTLTYSPTTLYEGDTVTFNATPNDLDKDVLTIVFEEQNSDGSWKKLYEKSNVTSGQVVTFSMKVDARNYFVRVRAIDPDNGSGQASVSFSPIPLMIKGKVSHTPDWQAIHEQLGTEENQFFAGEIFKTEALVTDYPIEYVTVTFKGEQITGDSLQFTQNMSPSVHPRYLADVHDERMGDPSTKLKNGLVYFVFTAKWSNGVIKQDVVGVNIVDDIYKAYNFYRTN